MATTRYTVIDGEVLSENRTGTKRDYVPDPLGSTVALLDNTQTKTDTFAYWPYGEVASRTGTTATPFQFVGTAGYYRDSSSRTYVQARYLQTQQGRWMTQDPINFAGGDWNLFRYVSNNPPTLLDRSGLVEDIIIGIPPKNPAPVEPGDAGTTRCSRKGNPWAIIDPTGCPLEDPSCMIKHERNHMQYIRACCALAGRCWQNAKTAKARQKCENKYLEWATLNKPESECKAYSEEKRCVEDKMRRHGCLTNPHTPFCQAFQIRLNEINDQINKWCNVWRRQTTRMKNCPFKSDGTPL